MRNREQELEDRIRQLETEVRKLTDEKIRLKKEITDHADKLEHWVNKYFPKPT